MPAVVALAVKLADQLRNRPAMQVGFGAKLLDLVHEPRAVVLAVRLTRG